MSLPVLYILHIYSSNQGQMLSIKDNLVPVCVSICNKQQTPQELKLCNLTKRNLSSIKDPPTALSPIVHYTQVYAEVRIVQSIIIESQDGLCWKGP